MSENIGFLNVSLCEGKGFETPCKQSNWWWVYESNIPYSQCFIKKSGVPTPLTLPSHAPGFLFPPPGESFERSEIWYTLAEKAAKVKSRLHRKYIQTSFIFTTFNRNSTRAIRLMLPSWYKCSVGETGNIYPEDRKAKRTSVRRKRKDNHVIL